MRALEILTTTGKAGFPCIRFYAQGPRVYRYGDLYPRLNPRLDIWKVGDRQQ